MAIDAPVMGEAQEADFAASMLGQACGDAIAGSLIMVVIGVVGGTCCNIWWRLRKITLCDSGGLVASRRWSTTASLRVSAPVRDVGEQNGNP